MHYLYQKDERALPGNFQNRKNSFLYPQMKCLSLPPHFLSSLSVFIFVRTVIRSSPTQAQYVTRTRTVCPRTRIIHWGSGVLISGTIQKTSVYTHTTCLWRFAVTLYPSAPVCAADGRPSTSTNSSTCNERRLMDHTEGWDKRVARPWRLWHGVATDTSAGLLPH
jgi:hypothetical protein